MALKTRFKTEGGPGPETSTGPNSGQFRSVRDGKFHTVELRTYGYSHEREHDVSKRREQLAFPHIHPGSTLVAPMGNLWTPGAWQRVLDMVMESNRQGHLTWLEEMPDSRGELPYAANPMQHDMAHIRARNAGMEYVLMLDCDVEPEPDTLVRLMRHELPIIVPFMKDEGNSKNLGREISYGNPPWEKDSGIRPVQWATLSFLLIRSNVFNCFGGGPVFGGSLTERPFFERLWYYGHRAYMDTSVEVKGRAPSFPGDMDFDERWERLKEVDKKRRVTPDRAPIDPDTKDVIEGVYLPNYAERMKNGANGVEPTRAERRKTKRKSKVKSKNGRQAKD